jgi:hypothetical protein
MRGHIVYDDNFKRAWNLDRRKPVVVGGHSEEKLQYKDYSAKK